MSTRYADKLLRTEQHSHMAFQGQGGFFAFSALLLSSQTRRRFDFFHALARQLVANLRSLFGRRTSDKTFIIVCICRNEISTNAHDNFLTSDPRARMPIMIKFSVEKCCKFYSSQCDCRTSLYKTSSIRALAGITFPHTPRGETPVNLFCSPVAGVHGRLNRELRHI